jgi:sugar-specific transcriptional regulator TrmB
MFEKYLQEIGLSEKEAQIYLALLQVDNESIQDLAKRTDINRTTVYPVLESLEKKGLVSEIQAGKKTHYEAASPERLETFVERQKVILEERSERLKDVIPQIKGIQREKGERPIVKYFEGRDGAISAYQEFYSAFKNDEKKGYFIFNVDLLQSVFTEKEMGKFREIRKGKHVYPISVYNASAEYQFSTDSGERMRIDNEKFPILADISIIDDQIILTTLGENVSAMLIKSKDFADTLKSLIKRIHEK